MYPDGPRTSVQPGPLGAELEGASRPTHFAGVLTVVLKLLQIVRPDRAFFGEKDYQQLVLIRQMVADLNVDVADRRGADRAGGRRAGDVVAQPLPRRRRARAGRCAVGGAAGRNVRGVTGARRGAGRGARGARRGARDRRRLPARFATRGWGPRPPRGRAACWSPPGWAPPDCSTTSRSTSGAGRHRRTAHVGPTSITNCLEELMLRTMRSPEPDRPWGCARAASDRRPQHPHRGRPDRRVPVTTPRWCSTGGFAPSPR